MKHIGFEIWFGVKSRHCTGMSHNVNAPFYLFRYILQISNSAMGAFGGPVAGMIFLGGLFPQANWIVSLIAPLIIKYILSYYVSSKLAFRTMNSFKKNAYL